MKIKVNGIYEEIKETMSILAFLDYKNINEKLVVVEYNYEIPEKDKWESIMLKENDNLEVIEIIGGG